MDPSAISTSSITSRIAGSDSNANEPMMSPVSSPVPNGGSQFAQQARRRSYVSEEAEAWASQKNGKTNGESPRFRQNSGDNGFKRPLSIDTSNGDSSRAQGSADGFMMSPRLETGGFESKLGRISDATEENEPDSDAEDEGLTEADRKRRQQLRSRPRSGTVDEPGGSGGPNGILNLDQLADAAVMRRSVVNVVLIGLWYFFSLAISIYNKWMFSPEHLDFRFPLFTTATHMLMQFSLASLVLYFFPKFRPSDHSGESVPSQPNSFRGLFDLVSKWFYLTRLGPCGAATGLDIGLGNMSLKFISLTFFTMCKSSALAFVLLFAFVFKLEAPSIKLVLIIATMTIGVVMMVFGEVNFNLLGFLLIIMSSFFSGFRWAVTQILLLRHPATSNPFASIFFLAPIMFAAMLVLAIPIETFSALGRGLAELIAKEGMLLGPLLLLFPGMLAFCMTSAEYALLQRTSVVTLSICGIFKEVVTITAAEIVYHDPLTPINLSGLCVTITAIGAYNYLKIQKMRRDARERAAERVASDSPRRDGMGLGYDDDADERRGMLADAVEMDSDDDGRGDDR